MMKKKSLQIKPIILFGIAGVLLLASTVGSTQAALTYYSENYSVEVTVSNIGVTLVENDKDISHRNYLENEKWDEKTGKLLENLLEEDEDFIVGKAYDEELKVRNSGAIDTYVRVIVTKSWTDENGAKDPTRSPDLIKLNLLTGENGWMIDENASTAERTVLYYKYILPAEKEDAADTEDASTTDSASTVTPAFSDTLKIDSEIGKYVVENITENKDGKTVTYTHEYDGYSFDLDVEVDAVQTHNAKDAIKSAWGIDVSVANDGSLSLGVQE